MTADHPIRAVIDTNVVLDWLVFGDDDAVALGAAIAQHHLVWLATPRMQGELRVVLSRPLAERWEHARKHALTIDATSMATACDDREPAGAGRLVCRDAGDQMFIDLALAHSPSWLITHDRALLALRRRAAARAVLVCTPAQWRQHAGLPP